MYESYFGFAESPFENNLDPRFLFISEVHKEVLAALSYFIRSKKGFALVCGDVGTGKTMLINSFLNTLPEYVQPIIIANPGVSSLEILRYIAKTLKIEVDEKDGIPELTGAMKERLKNAKGLNKQFVLIIDEAHLLSDQALEAIRLLSYVETQDQKLLQILLVGQYELSHKLDRPEMHHLRQRININRFLSPMSFFETRQYVDHRLRQVGSSFSTIFEDKCDSATYKMTGGVPRNINQLCDNALLICMSEMRRKVDRKILRNAQEALLTDQLFTPKFAPRTSVPRRKLSRVLIWTAVCVTFLALGIVLSNTIFFGKMSQQLAREVSLLTGSIPDPKAAAAAPAASAKNKIPVDLVRESSPKAVSPGGETSQNSAIPPAVPPTVSAETPKPPNLPPSSKQVARRELKKGETPSITGSQASRRSETFGIGAAILDNPEIKDRDIIHPGQAGFLPWINPNGQVMQHGQIMHLQDNLFYAYYGRYDSADTMKRVTSLLEQKGVKYTTIANDGPRILLGGYGTVADLQKALDLVMAK